MDCPHGLAQGPSTLLAQATPHQSAQSGMLVLYSCSPQPIAAGKDLGLALACAAKLIPNITPDVCANVLAPSSELGAD
jgi:hypothetical protein